MKIKLFVIVVSSYYINIIILVSMEGNKYINEYMGQVFTGKEFNQKFQNNFLVKLTNESENHNGFKYKTGLNIDTNKFNPTNVCNPGGLYITRCEDMFKWLNYNDNGPMVNFRSASIIDDSIVCIEKDKLKTDKLILGVKEPICDLSLWYKYEECYRAVCQNARALMYIKGWASFTTSEKNALLEKAYKQGYDNSFAHMEQNEEDICFSNIVPKINILSKINNGTNCYVKKIRSRRKYLKKRFKRSNSILLGYLLLLSCKLF